MSGIVTPIQANNSKNISANASAIDAENEAPKEPPYGCEYAKSNRATCKGCKESIAKGTLRMAVRFPSKFFDGMQENWHHFECFWRKARKNDINEASIRGMEWLKWEDQERIRARITELKESDGEGYTPKSAAVKIEHAKSGASKCADCSQGIQKGQLRVISRAAFHHLECFHKLNTFQKSADNLIGYEDLDDDEKQKLDSLFPKAPQTSEKRKHSESIIDEKNGNGEGTPLNKKGKLEDDEETRKALKNQSELLWKTRTQMRDNLDATEMEALLKENGNFKPKKGGPERMLDRLADMVVFGALKPCPECGGALNYSTNTHSYKCSGMVSDYTKCLYTTRQPERQQFEIPKGMKKTNGYLKALKTSVLPERIYPAATLNEQIIAQPKAFKNLDPTKKKSAGSSSGGDRKWIEKHGHVVGKLSQNGILTKLPPYNSLYPKCEFATTTHVYIDPETKRPWEANLTHMDISSGKNSYYKLQIVKDDNGSNFYLFRAWGRVGTEMGGAMTQEYGKHFEDCMEEFKRLFKEKSQNDWETCMAGNFKKQPMGMDFLEVDFTGGKKNDKKAQKLDVDSSKSALARPVKEIISMIFDMTNFNNTLKELEIDLTRMPMGHLSRNHILKAYKILQELQTVLEKQQQTEQGQEQQPVPRGTFVDFTNRFYTLIPHATGMKSPPMLDNMNQLKDKCNMLDNLLEMEIASSILKSEEGEQETGKDAFDMHYERLKCKMEVLDQSSREFELIKKYVELGHAPTHDIRLEIINVIKVDREMETKRFKKDIGNLHLLWHGSRLSNYAGILSQGLRIAPPEAPVTGYMFGKGIYSADMVSKSANYCYTMPGGEALLLLCEVALGQVQEERHARDLKKPKRGNNSVKGIGGTIPNPTEYEQFDGATVPCGKPIKSNEKDLSLLYNEYVVYDEAQVRMRYLVRVRIDSNLL